MVEPPLWKIWKSVGMIIPNIRKNKTCSKPPTKWWFYSNWRVPQWNMIFPTCRICWASPPASLASPRSLVTTMANWLHGATANGPGDSWGDLGPYKCRGSLWDATKETSMYIYIYYIYIFIYIYIWLPVRCCPFEARASLRKAALEQVTIVTSKGSSWHRLS